MGVAMVQGTYLVPCKYPVVSCKPSQIDSAALPVFRNCCDHRAVA